MSSTPAPGEESALRRQEAAKAQKEHQSSAPMQVDRQPGTKDPSKTKTDKTDDKDKDKKKKPAKHKYPENTRSFMVNGVTFTVDRKYSPMEGLGKGAYGVVCSATDKTTGKKVAIKKCTNVFDDPIGAKRVLREVKLLRHLKHENVVGLYDLIIPPHDDEPESFNDVYLVLDLMDTDMGRIIDSDQPLSDKHIQFFVYQTLCGLKFIHSAKVVHRDIKPGNLLLNADCELKICDFGLSRGLVNSEQEALTKYVVTRWYRAPEVLCACKEYDTKIDVWSVGCILAELHGREPIFPGDDYISQLELIFSILGSPSEEDLKFITNPRAVSWIQKLKKFPKVSFSRIYAGVNAQALDLLEKMLVFNPSKRITIDQALQHPYLAGMRDPAVETKCSTSFEFEYDNDKEMSKGKLRELLWGEIRGFHPELKQWWGKPDSGKADTKQTAASSSSSSSSTSTSTSSSTSSSGRSSISGPSGTGVPSSGTGGTSGSTSSGGRSSITGRGSIGGGSVPGVSGSSAVRTDPKKDLAKKP